MSGGPSREQKDAAARQGQLASTEADLGNKEFGVVQDAYNTIKPLANSRINSGLPYFNYLTDSASGDAARAFAPARGALSRRLSLYGNSLPSGYADEQNRQLDEGQSQLYDQGLKESLGANEQSKIGGAGLLTGQQQIADPNGYFQGAGAANNSIIGANSLQRPGLAGLFGGIASGAASAIPF